MLVVFAYFNNAAAHSRICDTLPADESTVSVMAKDTLIDHTDLNIAQAKPIDIPAAPLLPLKDEEQEKQSIIRALQSCGGVKTKAAEMLKVDSSTLYRKMKKYGIK